MRTKSFDHGELKHPFSQVKRNLNFQEILKLAPLPQKKKKKKKRRGMGLKRIIIFKKSLNKPPFPKKKKKNK